MIVRYLRGLNWAVLAISGRLITATEMSVICAVLGYFCLPECGTERASILLLAVGNSHCEHNGIY